ncbi:MAG: nuclear transport factor 2 family protein [Planctomycetaceae bacterium]
MQSPPAFSNPRFIAVSGALLRRLRMERGMTQFQLARIAGYTERLVRKAEKGGRLDIVTIRNLASALSMGGQLVSPDSLCLDNLSVAKLWVQGFDELGAGMSSAVEPYLSEDFVLDCPGDPETTPFAGIFEGLSGLQQWLTRYFSVFEHRSGRELEFIAGSDSVVARWREACSLRGSTCRPIRVSMYFRFRDGMIVRIEKDYDTKAVEDAILNALEHQIEPPESKSTAASEGF